MLTDRTVTASILVAVALCSACRGEGPSDGRGGAAGVGMPLHLEEHLGEAKTKAQLPAGSLVPMRWSFHQAAAGTEPAWQPLRYPNGYTTPVTRTTDALVVSIAAGGGPRSPGHVGGVVTTVPDLDIDDWGELLVRARSRGAVRIHPAFNLGERAVPGWDEVFPVRYLGKDMPVISDGQEHTYRLRADEIHGAFPAWESGEPWRELALLARASEPATLEILSIEVVPKLLRYAAAAVGVVAEQRGATTRRSLYSHVPGQLTYRLDVPAAGRLDLGLAALQKKEPITFRIVAAVDGEETVLLSERIDAVAWQQRSVDLAAFARRRIDLSLTADGDPGAIAFWASPTLSGAPPPSAARARPNVIFYVIDGAGADLMSLYGYPRRTTPHLERIAAEGVVFTRAYSNAGWTKPSTASFMTSLQQSVLGGFLTLADRIPPSVPTMAELFHGGGYLTATFSANPWAGSLSGLERGNDWFCEDPAAEGHAPSSRPLHQAYWSWREQYPGRPYWVHFQPTDVHEPHRPVAPFAGLFVSPERRAWFEGVWEKLQADEAGRDLWRQVKDPESTLADLYRERLRLMGVDPREFFNVQRGLYDETMAHQDEQLGRLVERLKANGEWSETLLVVAADHGHPAGSFSRFGRELFDPLPASDEGALLDSYRTHIPLVFVWPGKLAGGRRVETPVSMIDVLPTLVELAGLAPPEVMQGQSLVPLLSPQAGRPWAPRPVILEQLQPVADPGGLVGHIEMIDGRWGASLEVWPEHLDPRVVRPVGNQRAARPHRAGMPALYLYDVWDDPFARQRVNDRYPELVEKYTKLLTQQWQAHAALARRFQPGAENDMTPEQVETLRALGYIQ
jgi:arylsulfatase A-like enzyme